MPVLIEIVFIDKLLIRISDLGANIHFTHDQRLNLIILIIFFKGISLPRSQLSLLR